MGVKGYLMVAVTHFSRRITVLGLLCASLEKPEFKYFPHFLSRLFCFDLWNICVLDFNLLSDTWFVGIWSLLTSYVFTVNIILWCTKVFTFFFFLTSFHYVTRAGFQFMNLLSQSPKFWDYRGETSCLPNLLFVFLSLLVLLVSYMAT